MRSATPRLVLTAALAGALSAYPNLRTVEAAPESAASAAPSASATAGAKGGVAVDAYAWPTEAAPEPKEEAWAGATALETPTIKDSTGTLPPACDQQALGSWLRITCTPPATRHAGAIWGLAGDTAKAKGKFLILSEILPTKQAPTSVQEGMERKMGVSATITIPVTPGSAVLLRLDWVSWEEEWDWSGVVASPGIFIDVSWALGETHPTILYR